MSYAFLCKACKELWIVFVQRKLPAPEETKCPWCAKAVGE
jgi:hypothetical protein